VVEARSNETGLHVFRVGEMARLLGELAGHNERDCAMLNLTAPMHDLGKLGIPDHILHKAGPLTAPEWAIMRDHASIGHKLLCRSRRPALQAAAIIAAQHHERWDGSGYPHGLGGADIHPFGRIVAIIDSFDALSHLRCYKQAWEIQRIIDYIRGNSGRQFDPVLAEIFLDHIDDFVELANRYPDPAARSSAPS
jgi:response regulator RpfG family c-di-GMP phosphodiesterase